MLSEARASCRVEQKEGRTEARPLAFCRNCYLLAFIAVPFVAIQVHLVTDRWIGHAVSTGFHMSRKLALKACIGLHLYGEVVPSE